jgi:hypothetical protein
LLQTLAALGYTGATAVTVHRDEDASMLAVAGAGHVLHPYRNAADFAADLVSHSLAATSAPARDSVLQTPHQASEARQAR